MLAVREYAFALIPLLINVPVAVAETVNPAFTRNGPIKGIGVSPPISNWEAPAYGLSQARLEALEQAGFNTLRIWISLDEFLAPPVSMEATLSRWTGYISRAAETGFRVQVSWASTWEQRIAVVNEATTNARFERALGALCGTLNRSFSEEQVALEMLNEPPGEQLAPSYYTLVAPGWYSS